MVKLRKPEKPRDEVNEEGDYIGIITGSSHQEVNNRLWAVVEFDLLDRTDGSYIGKKTLWIELGRNGAVRAGPTGQLRMEKLAKALEAEDADELDLDQYLHFPIVCTIVQVGSRFYLNDMRPVTSEEGDIAYGYIARTYGTTT